MKISFRPFHILIISERILNFIGRLTGVGNKAKGAASFPVIAVRSEEWIQPWLINHELIHFKQQIETLIIGAFIFNNLERLYGRLILRKNKYDTYLWSSSEQEAYLNQHDLNYLKTRHFWAQFKYLSNKKKISVPKAGEVLIG